jgi:histidine ammonia-lyase
VNGSIRKRIIAKFKFTMVKKNLIIGSGALNLEQLENFLLHPAQLKLSGQALRRINASSRLVQKIACASKPVYGINTGFGNFAEIKIKPETVNELQRRLILSHAAGIGAPMPRQIVRLILLLKIQSLAHGYSGCRLEVVHQLFNLLNNDILPVIPQKGSVGASGDLAPLAHLAMTMMGEGEAFIRTKRLGAPWIRVPAKKALQRFKIQPLIFAAKEGLAILNGTQAMTAYALLALLKVKNLIKAADIIGAMSLESLLGSLTPFDHRIQEIRNHPGQRAVAENFRRILGDSPIVESHKYSDHKVQDAYSLRCIPQVHGAVRDALSFIAQVIMREVNGVNDNPVIFAGENQVLSGGNFHGAPVAYATDFLAIVCTDLASISERRIEHMVDPAVSQLPAFLVREGGLNSGFMMAHVTAAALVAESKILAHPASIDSIPTSANREDHVSMGLHAARKACEIVKNLENVLAIELLCACQALEFKSPLKPATASRQVLKQVRRSIPSWSEDRFMHKDIVASCQFIRSGMLVKTVEKICGVLQ